MLRRAIVAVLMFAATTAEAEIVTVRYDFGSVANYGADYRYFGGDLGPITGSILSTSLAINYTTTDEDAADFRFAFDVPVTGAQEEFINVTGSDLGWSGSGDFHYGFEASDLYNGTIRDGGFGLELSGGGELTDSYIEFVVDADAPDPIYVDGFDGT